MKSIVKKESGKFTQDFDSLYESYFSRYTAGCFGIGDVIQFDKKILSDEHFKTLAPEMRTKLTDMVESSLAGDSIIAVAQVDLDGKLSNWAEASTITIGYSQGGGMFYGKLTVPGSLGQYMTRVGDVYSQLPKNAIRVHSSEKRAIDDNTVTKAFRSGFVDDARAKRQQKKD